MFHSPKTWGVILFTITNLLVLLGLASADTWANDLSGNTSIAAPVVDPDETPQGRGTDNPPIDQPPLWVGWIELSGSLRDSPPPFAWVGPEQAGGSLASILRALDRVATGEDFAGVVIYLDDPRLVFHR